MSTRDVSVFKAQPDCPQCHGAGMVYAGFTQCGCIRLADDTPAPRREDAAGAEPPRASPYALDELLTIIGVLKNALSTAEREREADALDAKRWRWFRQFLSIDGDYTGPEEGNPPHVQWIRVDDDKLLDAAQPGWTHTVESLADAARVPSGGEEGRHVCGVRGFDGMQGDTCPACAARAPRP